MVAPAERRLPPELPPELAPPPKQRGRSDSRRRLVTYRRISLLVGDGKCGANFLKQVFAECVGFLSRYASYHHCVIPMGQLKRQRPVCGKRAATAIHQAALLDDSLQLSNLPHAQPLEPYGSGIRRSGQYDACPLALQTVVLRGRRGAEPKGGLNIVTRLVSE